MKERIELYEDVAGKYAFPFELDTSYAPTSPKQKKLRKGDNNRVKNQKKKKNMKDVNDNEMVPGKKYWTRNPSQTLTFVGVDERSKTAEFQESFPGQNPPLKEDKSTLKPGQMVYPFPVVDRYWKPEDWMEES